MTQLMMNILHCSTAPQQTTCRLTPTRQCQATVSNIHRLLPPPPLTPVLYRLIDWCHRSFPKSQSQDGRLPELLLAEHWPSAVAWPHQFIALPNLIKDVFSVGSGILKVVICYRVFVVQISTCCSALRYFVVLLIIILPKSVNFCKFWCSSQSRCSGLYMVAQKMTSLSEKCRVLYKVV